MGRHVGRIAENCRCEALFGDHDDVTSIPSPTACVLDVRNPVVTTQFPSESIFDFRPTSQCRALPSHLNGAPPPYPSSVEISQPFAHVVCSREHRARPLSGSLAYCAHI